MFSPVNEKCTRACRSRAMIERSYCNCILKLAAAPANLYIIAAWCELLQRASSCQQARQAPRRLPTMGGLGLAALLFQVLALLRRASAVPAAGRDHGILLYARTSTRPHSRSTLLTTDQQRLCSRVSPEAFYIRLCLLAVSLATRWTAASTIPHHRRRSLPCPTWCATSVPPPQQVETLVGNFPPTSPGHWQSYGHRK